MTYLIYYPAAIGTIVVTGILMAMVAAPGLV